MTTTSDDAPTTGSMTPDQMRAVIDRHLAAENAKDVAGAVAVYTDDVEHDSVGAPTGPLHGRHEAQGFYDFLTANVTTVEMTVNHEYFAPDACIVEHQWTGTVEGELIGIPGHGKSISVRMLHVFEFANGRISRENVWLDGASIAAQLTGDPH